MKRTAQRGWANPSSLQLCSEEKTHRINVHKQERCSCLVTLPHSACRAGCFQQSCVNTLNVPDVIWKALLLQNEMAESKICCTFLRKWCVFSYVHVFLYSCIFIRRETCLDSVIFTFTLLYFGLILGSLFHSVLCSSVAFCLCSGVFIGIIYHSESVFHAWVMLVSCSTVSLTVFLRPLLLVH